MSGFRISKRARSEMVRGRRVLAKRRAQSERDRRLFGWMLRLAALSVRGWPA